MEKYENYRENILSSHVYSGIQLYFCYMKLRFFFMLNAIKLINIIIIIE